SEDCDDNDPLNTNSNVNDADCDGVPTSEDCDDNDPLNTNSNVNDADCDGVPTSEDCDDNDPLNTNSNVNDADCDGVPTSEDCDDNDPLNTNSNVNDADCDGVPTSEDCDDNDPTVGSNANDADCDGVPTSEDCDDNDPLNTNSNVNDADCDGVPTSEDCDDNDPLNTNSNVNDADCDGVPTSEDCDDNDPAVGSNCMGEINATKTADMFGTNMGDTITYTIQVENTGDVTLTDVNLIDTFIDSNGNPLFLTTEPSFVTSDLGSPEGVLLEGEIATYSATFIINEEALFAGGVQNSVIATGITSFGESVEDTSDDGDDFDNNTVDDPTVTELGCLEVFNEFSPNGDGVNETLIINCIQNYPNNKLEVYNRWGNLVFETRRYLNDWSGTSNGRSTINGSDKLPVGTYYYVLNLGDGSKPRIGWLYINR
ncbi:hypothetical protein A9Q87_06665, partial [Flavobacteriales bacterium 34_180_T64]